MGAKGLIRAIAGTIWIYSYLSLGAFMAVAALPALALARWGWSLDVHPAWAGSFGSVLDNFVGLYWSIIGFFTFGLALMVVLPAVRMLFLLMGWKPHTGAIKIHSFRIWFWYNHNGLVFLFNTVYGRFARLTNVYNWYLRAMGAKIGRNVVFNTQHVYDLDLISVGDDTVIGANASILGHVGEKGSLVREKVVIGNRCTIGQYTNIFPGVTMGDNCHIGAMSLVPKGTTLDGDAIYGGVPVRKIRDLVPGERVTANDVSATTGSPKAE